MAESDAPTFVLQAIAPTACGEWITGRGTGRTHVWFGREMVIASGIPRLQSNKRQKIQKKDSKYTGAE